VKFAKNLMRFQYWECVYQWWRKLFQSRGHKRTPKKLCKSFL